MANDMKKDQIGSTSAYINPILKLKHNIELLADNLHTDIAYYMPG